jgi:NTP pyrophosphatase (non-canonical NTP hydrolase)
MLLNGPLGWPTFDELKIKVVRWASDRGIIQNSSAQTQLFKAFSEMGELADATIKKDESAVIDAVGDVLVCLINYCEIQQIDIVGCLGRAYNEIKDRRGTLLPNGCFVKDLHQDVQEKKMRVNP